MLEAYRQHVAERAAEQIPPKPLTPEWTAALAELLKKPTSRRRSIPAGPDCQSRTARC